MGKGGGEKSQGGDEHDHQSRPQAANGSFHGRLQDVGLTHARLIDILNHNQAHLHGHAEKSEHADAGRDTEVRAGNQQGQHASNRRRGQGRHDQQRPIEGTERRIEKQDNQQDGNRNNQRQPGIGALLAGVFARPLQGVAQGQLHFLAYVVDGIPHRAAQVAAAHAVLDGDIARVVFAVNHGGAIFNADVAELPQRTRSPEGARMRMLAMSSTVVR